MNNKGRLTSGVIVRGGGLPEAVRLASVSEQGNALHVTGIGLNSGKLYDQTLDTAALAALQIVPPDESAPPDPAALAAPGGPQYHFLSALLNSRVYDEPDGRPIGRLHDIGARMKSPYPVAVCFEVRGERGRQTVIPWAATVSLAPGRIVVRRGAEEAPPPEFWLRRDMLDDQVVDVSGAKVVRVNDVHLLHAEGRLIVGHVDVGVRGLLRRLGVERAADVLLRWLLDYTIKEDFVSCRHVEVLLPGASPGGLRVSRGADSLAEVHPAELADIMEELGAVKRRALLNALPVATAAEVMEELDPNVQRAIVSEAEPGKVADLLEEMSPQEAASLLRDVYAPDAQRMINRMESEAADDVREILSHEEASAGGVMTTSCIEAGADELAGAVFERVRAMADEVEVFHLIFVIDGEHRLVGVLNLRELMRAAPDAALRAVMTTDVISARPDTSLKDTARLLMKYGLRALPVVDERNVFLGAVRFMTMMGELLPEYNE